MSQLLKLPNPFSCPHGRPTVIKRCQKQTLKRNFREGCNNMRTFFDYCYIVNKYLCNFT